MKNHELFLLMNVLYNHSDEDGLISDNDETYLKDIIDHLLDIGKIRFHSYSEAKDDESIFDDPGGAPLYCFCEDAWDEFDLTSD